MAGATDFPGVIPSSAAKVCAYVVEIAASKAV
jgi:hypothetical protein